jgi:hypothetical protein
MCLPVQSNLFKTEFTGRAAAKNSLSNVSSSSADSFDFPVFTVPTFREKPIESIDISSLSSSEVDSLKEKDPFMYYSIPAVRKSAMRSQEVDHSILGGDASPSSDASSQEGSRKSRKISQTITKKRRLSMEMHPDALMEELLNDSSFMSRISMTSGSDDDNGNIDINFEDSLLSLFEDMTK